MTTGDERPGLELALIVTQTGMNYREFKKWLREELAALDAEHDEEYLDE